MLIHIGPARDCKQPLIKGLEKAEKGHFDELWDRKAAQEVGMIEEVSIA